MSEVKHENIFTEFYDDLIDNWKDNDYIIQKITNLNLNECNFLPWQKKFLEGYLLKKQGKYEDAFKCFQESNEIKENSYALNSLASCYYDGKGVKKNIDEAVRLFQILVKKGNTIAMFNLAVYYEDNKNIDEAIKYYKLAIEKGEVIVAMYNLALCYYAGRGIKKDYVEAIKCYKMAFEKECMKPNPHLDFYSIIECYSKLSFDERYKFYKSLSKNSPILTEIQNKLEYQIECLRFDNLKMQEKIDELERQMYLPPYVDARLPNGGPGFQNALLTRNNLDE